ncbi:membrane-associated protein [Gammaproteobacteria bacterium]
MALDERCLRQVLDLPAAQFYAGGHRIHPVRLAQLFGLLKNGALAMEFNFLPSLQSLLGWITAHPTWAGLAVFFTALSESLAFVGIIFPGAMMMFGFGAVVATGAMAFWPTFFWAVIGAIAGDGLSFWLGHHFRDQLRTLWPFSRYPEMLEMGVAFFQRHGGKSILFGRFVGPVRPVIPVVAGMLGMPMARFLGVNVLSALAWGPAYLLPGMMFGASLSLAAEVASRLVIVLVGVVGTVWLSFFVVHRLFRFLQARTDVLLRALLRFSTGHPWFERIGRGLFDSSRPETQTLLTMSVLLMLGTVLFATVLVGVMSGRTGLDHVVYHLLQDLRTPWGDDFLVAVTEIGDASVMLTLFVAVFAYLLWQGRLPVAGYWLAAAGFGVLVTYLFKFTLQIPRPTVHLYPGVSDFSFPSSHTTASTVMFGFVAVLLAREMRHTAWRWIPYATAAALALIIAFSRLYLGVHWLSDAIGGFSLGVAWVALLGIAYYRHRLRPIPLAGLVGATVLPLVLAGTWHVVVSHEADLERYAQGSTSRLLPAEFWWDEGWRELPTVRNDLRNQPRQPLDLQWAGSLESMREHLTTAGWQAHPSLSATNLLRLLAPNPTEAELPLIPHLLDGHPDALRLVRFVHPTPGGESQKVEGDHSAPEGKSQGMVVRLWTSGLRLLPGDTPLWVGYVNCLEPWHPIPWITVLRTNSCSGKARATLENSLVGLDLRTVHRLPSPGLLEDTAVLLIRAR